MPKHKLTEIDEILAKSRRLTSHIGDNDFHPRNVAELNEASKQLSRSSASKDNFADAYLLLSQKNFDAKKLHDDVNAIAIKSKEKEEERVHQEDLDKYLDRLAKKQLDSASDMTGQLMDAVYESANKDWRSAFLAKARRSVMDRAGHHLGEWEGAYGYSAPVQQPAAASLGGLPPSTPAKSSSSSSAVKVHNALLMTPASPFNLSALMTRPSQPNLTATPAAAPNHYAMTPGTATASEALKRLDHRPLHSPLLTAHTKLVQSLQQLAHSKTPHARVVLPCRELSEAIAVPPGVPAKTLISDGLTKSDLVAYRALLDLLSDIVGEGAGEPVASGFYSSICFEGGEVFPDVQTMRRKALTSGAKQYLEAQIAEIWSRAVDTAVYKGEMTVLTSGEGTAKQQRLRSYVSYQFRIGAIPQASGRVLSPFGARNVPISSSSSAGFNVASTPLWAFVYHCLRVGDLVAAVSELNKCVSAGYREGEVHAATAVRLLSQVGTSDLTDAEVRTLLDAMAECTAQYSADASHADEDAVDPYRLMVFNLLGLSDREGLATCPIPGFSLEDFQWSQLWFVHMSRLVSESMQASSGGAVSAGALTTSSYGFKPNGGRAGELELYDLILDYGGADYFDSDRASPFKYATVLFCCQRFGDAIAHLWATGKTVPAVHLTVVCLYYGLILPHQPLTENPRSVTAVASSRSDARDDVTPSLVMQVFLNTNIFLYYPECVVDYLLSLNTNWLTFAAGLDEELKELHKLKSQGAVTCILEMFVVSLDRDCLNVVVGSPLDAAAPAGQQVARGASRSRGRLDDYLEPDQVNMILCRAAYHKLAERREPESAVYMYHLAGRYTDVLSEMGSQLSDLLIPLSLSFLSAATPAGLRDAAQQQSHQLHRAAREHWRSLARNFVDRYMQSGIVQQHLTQHGQQDLAAVVVTLLHLFEAVDAYCANDYERCLELLDGQGVLPPREEFVDQCVPAATRPHLVRTLDDLLIIAIESTKALFQHAKATRMTLATTPFKQQTSMYGLASPSSGHLMTHLGVVGDKDIKMQALASRARGLVAFAGKVRAHLNRSETANVVSRIEASFI